MRVYEKNKESNSADAAGLTMWDEFLPYVKLDLEQFKENNESLDDPQLGEEPKTLSGFLDLLSDEQKKVYTIVTDEYETIIPLVIEKGSDKNLDEDGIIQVCTDKKVEGIEFEQESFETSVGKNILLKVTKTDPTFEDEIELKLIANDDKGYIGEEGELEDVLCGRVIVKFKKSIEYVSLKLKFHNNANNEPLAYAMVENYKIEGAYTYEQALVHGQKCPESPNEVWQKQVYLKHFALYNDEIDGDDGPGTQSAYKSFWSNRGIDTVNFTEKQLIQGIKNEHGNRFTDENGEIEFKILKSSLINADATLNIALKAIKSSLSSSGYTDSVEIKIKKNTIKFESFDGDDVSDSEEVNIYVNSVCACNRGFTKADFAGIAPGATSSNRDTYRNGINMTCNEFGIFTCLEKAHFIAQVLHESANLSATAEGNASTTAYGGFPGRGIMQLTYETMYEAYGSFIDDDFTSNLVAKQKLENAPHSYLSAGWLYMINKDPHLINASRNDDLLMVSARINGAFNGLDDRKTKLNGCKAYLKNLCSAPELDNNTYNFTDSGISDNSVYSFAWGIWHDSKFTTKSGVTKDNQKALEGYDKVIELNNTSLKNRYGTNALSNFSSYSTEEIDANGNTVHNWYCLTIATTRKNELNPPAQEASVDTTNAELASQE